MRWLCGHCLLVQRLGPRPAGPARSPEATRDRWVAARVEELGLGSHALVTEVGSRTGRTLRSFVDARVPVLGVEPHFGDAEIALDRGVPTLPARFDASLGARLATEGRRADLIVVQEVLDRVDDPLDFALGLAHALRRSGRLWLELRHVLGFEHPGQRCAFSAASLGRLLARAGLAVRRAELVDGNLCVEAVHADALTSPASLCRADYEFEGTALELGRPERYAVVMPEQEESFHV